MSEPRPLNFAVIGAGAWGTAMAAYLARRGQHTTLVTRRPEHAEAVRAARENQAYLAGIPLPEGDALWQAAYRAYGGAAS